jgi:O-succinylbenzoate synthase
MIPLDVVNADGAISGCSNGELVVDVSPRARSGRSVAVVPLLPQLEQPPARIEVRLLSLPTRRALGTAHDGAPSTDRELAVVGIETIDGVAGWGECSALNTPTYTAEWAADSFERLAAWANGEHAPVSTETPMAAAAVEMAITDAILRTEGRSLADALGTEGSVAAGATIGLAGVEESIRIAQVLVNDGFRKLKVKIDPSHVDDVAHELSHVLDGIELHVDANGSLGEEDLMALLGLTWHGVTAIEQPFPVDRPDLAAELMLGTDAVVVADEAATSVASAALLLEQRALGAVAIKPPRLGGIAAAVEMVRWCEANSIGASIGGMLESGLGRHALAAVAALEGFTITGDLSPARQWLAEDPWPDLEMRNGSIVVPRQAGVAPLPDLEVLEHFTVQRAGRTR